MVSISLLFGTQICVFSSVLISSMDIRIYNPPYCTFSSTDKGIREAPVNSHFNTGILTYQ